MRCINPAATLFVPLLGFFICSAEAMDGSFMTHNLEHYRVFSSFEWASHGYVSVTERSLVGTIPLGGRNNQKFALQFKGVQRKLSQALAIDEERVVPREYGSVESALYWRDEGEEGESSKGVEIRIGRSIRGLASSSQSLFTANAFKSWPLSDKGRSWVAFLTLSNQRNTMDWVPLPGFGYLVQREKDQFLIGLPFLYYFTWRDPYSFIATLSPFFSSFHGGWRIWGPVQLFSSFRWAPESAQNLSTKNPKENLIWQSTQVAMGVRMLLPRRDRIELAIIHSGRNRLFFGRSLYRPDSRTLHLDSGWSVRVSSGFSF